MAKKSKVDAAEERLAEQRERAKQLGTEAKRTRLSSTCPYAKGSELEAIWLAARFPNHRPMPEVKVPVESVVDRLNRYFRGDN